jgi:hypothetical protein
MAGLDEVLERLVTEPGFRTRLTSQPWAALAGYDLTVEERELLAERLIAGLGPWSVRAVESDQTVTGRSLPTR